MAIKKEYKKIIEAAKAGGKIVKKYFGKSLKIEEKSMPCDFRTAADLDSEKAIIKILEKSFPKYNIFSEEFGEINKGSEYTLVIDPLDGTNNFTLGIPYFSVSIGLTKKNDIIFGVVYNPILDNLYYAEKGKGAYLNNKKIKVNKETNIKNCSVSLVISYHGSEERAGKVCIDLYEKKDVKRVLTNWSVILDFCLLASGKIEAIIVNEIPLHDFVSGKLIAKEAGAQVTDFKNNLEKIDTNNTFLISNGTKIHKEIIDILKSNYGI